MKLGETWIAGIIPVEIHLRFTTEAGKFVRPQVTAKAKLPPVSLSDLEDL